jgi:anti-anti-sigma factor
VRELGTSRTEISPLEVDLSTADDASVIRVSGSLVGKAAAIFRRACGEATKSGLLHRVVDLSDVDEIDGYGIAGLVGLLARRKKAGGKVVLCGINPGLRLRFEATHCDTVFKMAVSTSGALELLKGDFE